VLKFILLQLHKLIRPKGKIATISNFTKGSILDIGSGHTPKKLAKVFKSLKYLGLDITDHNPTLLPSIGSVVLVEKSNFLPSLKKFKGEFDLVISSHNIEHVDDRWSVLTETAYCCKPEGTLYLSFPSARSVLLPRSHSGTLNYFDDPTHADLPPDLAQCLMILNHMGFCQFEIYESYRPLLARIIGSLVVKLDRESKLKQKLGYFMLAFYGFETVVKCRAAGV
jgi:SAM-dependent methyltransferase